MLPERLRTNPYFRFFLFLSALIFLLGFVIWFRDILVPFLLAFIFAYILDPVVDWMEENLALNRTASILVLVVLILIGLALSGYYLTTQLIKFGNQLSEVAQNPPDLQKWIQASLPVSVAEPLLGYIQKLKPQKLWQQMLTYTRSNLMPVTQSLGQGSMFLWLFTVRAFGALGAVINFGVFIIVTIYLLRDFDRIVAGIREYIPPGRRNEITELIREIDSLLRAFLRGQLTVCIIMGILYSVGLFILGINGAITLGVVSGLLNVIPYLGPALGFLLVAGFGLYQGGVSLWILLGVPAVFLIVQFVEGTFLTPNIIGRKVGINPVGVIFSFMFFVRLLGFIGFLAAVPLAVIFKVLFRRFLDKYRNSTFYAEKSSPEEEQT